MSEAMEQTKKCYKCKNELPISQFHKDKSRKNGVGLRCKSCSRIRDKERERFSKKYTEKELAAQRQRARERRRERRRERCNDTKFLPLKMEKKFSEAVRRAFKSVNMSKPPQWRQSLGYSAQELISHLEAKFKDGMTWDNYGSYWHIDHIVPKSWFKYESVEDEAFKKCWSLENLQPLTAKENISKGNRFAG